MLTKIILGAVLIGFAYKSEPAFAPVLFVQGMLLINFAFLKRNKY